MALPYTTYRSYLKKRFGEPILKVPVNGGFSCNNKKDSAGCTFCDNQSFSPAALKSTQVVHELNKVINRSRRFKKFIAYLQPNTNTYAPLDELKAMYEPLIVQEGVIGLAIGTRPDALGEDICDYLAELSTRTYLSMEVGIQSTNDNTLTHIRRGHDFQTFVDAVHRLNDRGIEVVAHLMVGLPGEGEKEAVESARQLAKLPIAGVKIHQLMVIDNTELAQEYKDGEFKTLTLEEYGPIVAKMIAVLPPTMHIHRIMADTKAEYGILSPLWSLEKDASMMWLQNYLTHSGVHQGDQYNEQ